MKKIKKVISLCTSVLMIFSLFSCAKGGKKTDSSRKDKSVLSITDADKTSDNNTHKITEYYDELTLKGTEDFSSIINIQYSGDKLYILGQKNPPINNSVFSTDLTTLETSQTQNDIIIPDDCNASDICIDSKGNIYDCSMGAVKIYDKDLKLIKTIDNKFFEDYDDVKKLFIYSSAVSQNGDIYIAASNKTPETIQIIKLNSLFEIQYITKKGEFSDCGDYIDKIIIGQNGNPILCTSLYSTYINEISSDTGRTVLRYELPLVEEIVGVYGNYSIIYRNGSVIYGYDYMGDSTCELYSADQDTSEIAGAYIRNSSLITEQFEKGNDEIILSVFNKDETSGKNISISGVDSVSDIKITSDGTVFFLNNNYEVEYTDDGVFETTQPEILRLKDDGTTETIYKGEKQYSENLYYFAADSKGNICVCSDSYSDDSMVHATYISSSGQQTEMTYKESGSVSSVQCINDEFKLIFTSFEKNRSFFLTVNNETLTIDNSSSEIEPPSNFTIQGGNGYDFYYCEGNFIYGYHMADGSSEKIFSWLDSDVESIPEGGIASTAIADSDNIFYVKYTYYDNGDPEYNHKVSVIHLKKADEARLEELNSRTIISLAGINITDSYFSRIKKFNKSNDDYMIIATDYSQYNSPGRYDDAQGLSKMEADIVQDNIPDIILGNWSLDYQSFLCKDAFANLSDFLRNDPEIDSSDLAENILDAFTYNGKLYCIPFLTSLTTLTVPEECIDNNDMLTYDEFFSLPEKFSSKSSGYFSRESFFDVLGSSYISENVDFQNATCNFETDTFKKILEAAKKCTPESQLYSKDYDMGYNGDTISESLFRINCISGLSSYFSCFADDNYEHVTYCLKGVPSSSGITCLFNIDSCLCITNSSKNKEGAWKFIKYFTHLNDSSDESFFMDDNLVSVFRSVNQKNIDNITSQMSDNQFSDYYQSDIDKITSSLNTLYNGKIINKTYYIKLLKIISEQAESFYNDSQSLDQTVSAIQSKANLYLSEIK